MTPPLRGTCLHPYEKVGDSAMPNARDRAVSLRSLSSELAEQESCVCEPAAHLYRFPDHSTFRANALGGSSWCRFAK